MQNPEKQLPPGAHRRPFKIELSAAVLIALLLASLSWPLAAKAEQNAPELFILKSASTTGASAPLDPWVAEETPVSINSNALSLSNGFSVNLFGQTVLAEQEAPLPAPATLGGPATQSTTGRLYRNGVHDGYFTVSRAIVPGEGAALNGFFERFDGTAYVLDNSPEGPRLRKLKPEGFPGCAAGSHDHETAPDRLEPPRAALVAADERVVDVLVAYTPAARDAEGGNAAMLALIQTAVAETNDAYKESNANIQIRLVHTHLLSSNSSGDFGKDLTRLQSSGDGTWDEVHALRDQYGADLVSVITNNGQYCGIGYILNASFPSPSLGFSVVYRSCATGYYSFGHELGHNLGLAHDIANGAGGAFSFSHGWHFAANKFRTIMAYAPGLRVGRFSNPDVFYEGHATGNAAQADNARTLDETTPFVAVFRDAVANPGSETPENPENPGSPSNPSNPGGSSPTPPSSPEVSLVLSKFRRILSVTALQGGGTVPHLTVTLLKAKLRKKQLKKRRLSRRALRNLRYRPVEQAVTDEGGVAVFGTKLRRGAFIVTTDASAGEVLSNRLLKRPKKLRR